MAKKKKGTILKLAMKCSECKSHNYITTRNKVNTTEKLSLKKFCNKCRKQTLHKETGKLD